MSAYLKGGMALCSKHSSISKISRDPTTSSPRPSARRINIPTDFTFLGTMFAPVKDRDAPGQGFTHKRDDIVTIGTPQLGKLVNRMRNSDECEPWTFGVGALMKNLPRKVLRFSFRSFGRVAKPLLARTRAR